LTSEEFDLRPQRPAVHLHENINFCFRTTEQPARAIEVLRVAYRDAGARWNYVRMGPSWENRLGSYGLRLYILAIPDEYVVAVGLMEDSDSTEFARDFPKHWKALEQAQAAIATGENEQAVRHPDDVGFGNLTARQVAQYVPIMRGLTPREIHEADAAAEAPLLESKPDESQARSRRKRWFR
jgi:hypothetical protein